MNIKRLKTVTRVCVRINGICFHSTVRQIRAGVGSEYKTNAALQKAVDALEFQRSCPNIGSAVSGIAGIWEGFNVQIDIQ
jgi:hypothetical protein